MDQAVGLRISYHFGHHWKKKARYEIIVKNLGYQKKVSLWAEKKGSWSDIFAEYKESLPGGLEKWTIETNDKFLKFAVKYQVNGQTYWDNNGGEGYSVPKLSDDFFVLTGSEFPIVLGESIYAQHKLLVYSAVQNRSIQKKVGLVYTTDNRKKNQNIYANNHFIMKSGIEVWKFEEPISTSSNIEFALFCEMNGNDYWDNNFDRNYIDKPNNRAVKADSGSSRSELWDVVSLQKAMSEKTEKKEHKIKESIPKAEPELAKAAE